MFPAILSLLFIVATLHAAPTTCWKQNDTLQDHEKSWLSRITHSTETLPQTSPQTTRLFCQQDNMTIEERSSIHWRSPVDGILSLNYYFVPDSQTVRYDFDMGTAFRGEGCALSIGDAHTVQTEKQCGTSGCSISVLHNGHEVYNTDKGSSCEMPADFIGNFYLMTGFDPSTSQTYEGLSTIYQNDSTLVMTRWINGIKKILTGREQVSPEGIRSLRFNWTDNQKKQLICQANSDADNWARISCKLFIQGTRTWGMENYFPYPTEIPFDQDIDLDQDGQPESILIQHLPESHQISLEASLSQSQTTKTNTFGLDDSGRMDAFCGHHITASPEAIFIDEKSPPVPGILLEDGLCDGIRVFWDTPTQSLQFFRN